MDVGTLAIVTNTLVILATFLATLYRIKIEREQIYTVKNNTKAMERLESLRNYVKSERKSLSSIEKKDVKELFDYLENLNQY